MALLTPSNTITDFERNGFAIIRSPFASSQILQLTTAIETFRESHTSALSAGLRNLLSSCAGVRQFANLNEMRDLIVGLQGESVRPVRSIFFDKTPASNWYVTWHQDLTIAVKERVDTPGFGPWSIKDGVVHVQPPEEILKQIISLRIHLDPCPEENGAIKFISGSHKNGILEPTEISRLVETQNSTVCEADRGDIILMSPLILHSSKTPDHRRVLHLEFSAAQLPNGLSWTEA